MKTKTFRHSKYGDLLVVIDDDNRYLLNFHNVQIFLGISYGDIVNIKRGGVKVFTKRMLSIDGNDSTDIFIDEDTINTYIDEHKSERTLYFQNWIKNYVIPTLIKFEKSLKYK